MFVRETHYSPLSPEQCREALLENSVAEVWFAEPSEPGDIISRESRRNLILMPRDIDDNENRDVVMKVRLETRGTGARVGTFIRPTVGLIGFALCFVPFSFALLVWGMLTAFGAVEGGVAYTDERVWVPVTVPTLLLGLASFFAWGFWRQSRPQVGALRNFVISTLRSSTEAPELKSGPP